MTEEKRPDWDYQDKLPAVDGVDTVQLPVRISQVEHTEVYRPERAPRWTSWVRTFFTRQGHLRTMFCEMSGGSPDMTPSYCHEYASPQRLAEAGIRRLHRWCESRNHGRTWRSIKTTDLSDRYTPRPDEFILLDDGALLGVGGVWAGWDEAKATYDTIGHCMAWRSLDDGETWSPPVSLNDPARVHCFWCHPKRLRNGTIVLPAYGCFDRANPSPQTDAFLYFSEDRGQTWSGPLLLARGIPARTNDEPEAVELENGDLLVVLRHANLTVKENEGLYMNCGQILVKRTPAGWDVGELVPTIMGFRGFPALLRTRDNIIICAGSTQQFNFSVDNGRTWSKTGSITDPRHKRMNHYPILTELPDGRVLSVYHYGNHWPYPPPEDEWIHATSFRAQRL
jgi:hypothetical protein